MSETVSNLRRRLYPFGDDRGSVPGRRDVDHFLVTSWGHSGSIWLAGSLNLHHAICATVGTDNPIECFRYYRLNRDGVALARQAGRALCGHGFSAWESEPMEAVRALPEMEGVPGTRRDYQRLPSYVFDELDHLAATQSCDVAGNIHGVTLDQLQKAFLADPGIFRGRRVLLADLIRHPVGRTESAINATMTGGSVDVLRQRNLAHVESATAAFLHEHAHECRELERRYGLDFSEPRPRAALHVFRQGLQNDVWAYELRHFPDVHRIRLEPLQDSPDYFAHVFSTLAQGRAVPDDDYLARVFSPANLGSGRQSTTKAERPARPREQFALWSPFERDEFVRIAQRLNLPALYFPFGYDLSFVVPPGKGRAWFASMLDPASTPD